MLNINHNLTDNVRRVKAKVELYNGSTLVDTITAEEDIISIDIERVGDEGKFFGFVVIQKANLHLRDLHRQYDITTANSFRVLFANNGSNFATILPKFYVTEVNRDEVTNELSITAYDVLYSAKEKLISEIDFSNIYSITDFVAAVENHLRCFPSRLKSGKTYDITNDYVADYINIEGTESIYECLTAAAEVMGAVIYAAPYRNWELDLDSEEMVELQSADILVTKGIAGAPVALKIDKADYIDLSSKTNRKLTTIVSATELGDNISATTGEIGTAQYLRNNAFLELREDVPAQVEAIKNLIGGLTINQFTCIWRGNYLLEVADKIELVTKDNKSVYSYVYNDAIRYDGALSETTSWEYIENEGETLNNPVTLGDALRETYAKVDKANKQIDIVVSENEANKSAIAALQLNTDSISATVTSLAENTIVALENNAVELADIKKSVNAQMTAEDITVLVKNEIDNGVTKVETTTGVVVDENGLTVNKSDSEMETTISDVGMTVYKKDKAILTATSESDGVNARNLHATTYLIIGKTSRFEDYGKKRTGCFWIGG